MMKEMNYILKYITIENIYLGEHQPWWTYETSFNIKKN